MELKITTSYCLCDDFLISKGWRDDPQCTMSTAEVMTAALTAAVPAVMKKAAYFLSSIPESVWRGLTKQLAMPFHEMNSLKIYPADSFPVPVCRNIRVRRCEIYQDECFWGRVSSRKEYFYGLKVHALMTESGIPVEIFLSPWSYSAQILFMTLLFLSRLEMSFMEIKHIMPTILKMSLSSQAFI